ncbi:unnamed protein product [Aspergillus oryzae]|uniref:Unnamed protein product n=2 Tax=Aspergillus oryzae TaxID=5062 RepID=A0AAN5BYD1_ASPOZ|nr:unnamed protein product [Aspergillus oryzae]GMF91265.1 unnamed protein product [Aspergillus oryzae]GMG39004.1 unnamed protein product [Aspergillus oryzae]GMG49158.1 unnamed protein product [Aspergillus oryzae var. brunneus]
MDDASEPADTAVPEHHIVKADEVDQTGTDISPVSDDQLMEEVAEGLRQERVSGSTPSAPGEVPMEAGKPYRRPELRRDAAAPPLPLQPPPPAPVQQSSERPTDSLSLAQLRQFVQEMPRIEQPAYAFVYADSQPFAEEIEEWFQYSEFDRAMLLGMKSSFEKKWASFLEAQNAESSQISWIDTTDDQRRAFMAQMVNGIREREVSVRLEALEVVCYTVTGVWGTTAGRDVDDYPEDPSPMETAEVPKSKSLQISWIENNANLVLESSGLAPLFECLCRIFERNRTSYSSEPASAGAESANPASLAAMEREANLILTAFYMIVEVGRKQEAQDPRHTPLRNALIGLKPNLLVFLVEVIARLRWDDSANIPLTRIILLFWKSLLLFFGGSDELKRAKEELEPKFKEREDDTSRRTPFLTASPLDYHIFRQEITSKYPAYNPPPPVVPLELENNSILPPLPQHPSRGASSNGLFSGVGPSVAGGNGSILHQSVHIATPAPSPPPSPIGPGGKAGKKQNYQTNQNFPFMYPPLDVSSNDIGGKGTTELQDVLVGKRWEGSDVPASIIEAGKLFSTHVKMTRAMRQLWEERERFMKYDRGWYLDDSGAPSDENIPDELLEDFQDLDLKQGKKNTPRWSPSKETDDEDIQRRLDAVESFYVSFPRIFRIPGLTSFLDASACAFAIHHHCILEDNPDKCQCYGEPDPRQPRHESDQPPEPSHSDEESSGDEAVPPPIARHRSQVDPGNSSVRVQSPEDAFEEFLNEPDLPRPEVDELGYPTAPPPKEPIKVFSFRNFFSAINYLHIMQKITRDKAHRCLLLVQYKSSTILRKGLKIPDPHLRFYTLKLFKSQVPYCGRKWRQSNMRVITAIYLYCRPELRDDWLAGSDIDAEVEEALPLEQALRGLTHWWHLRRYKDVMGGEEGASLMEEERDFFVRELEAMGWGFAGEEMLNGTSEEAEMAAAGGQLPEGTEWDGGPLQMEGW